MKIKLYNPLNKDLKLDKTLTVNKIGDKGFQITRLKFHSYQYKY